MLKYGNHKSAEKEQEHLVGMLREEVQWMWQLPLPCRAIAHIPDCIMAPLSMALQQTINEFGEIVAKWRLTHDQTYEPMPASIGLSTIAHDSRNSPLAITGEPWLVTSTTSLTCELGTP
jgi:hypothetical protein